MCRVSESKPLISCEESYLVFGGYSQGFTEKMDINILSNKNYNNIPVHNHWFPGN